MDPGILVAIALVIGAVLIVNQMARLIRNASLQRSIREAINRDSSSLPDLIARIDGPSSKGTSTDERAGLVLIALALALALFGIIAAAPDDVQNVIGLSLFPLFVGVALLGRVIWIRKHGEGR